jgi:alpha-glucosidase (family GH31 glycosyl hydrolase)
MINNAQSAIQLLHLPEGSGHPYRHVSYERVPHMPIEGETTSLGLSVVSVEEIHEVAVELWDEDSIDKRRFIATCIETDQDSSFWQVSLPKLTGGEAYAYQFLVQSTTSFERSEVFKFEVLRKVVPVELSSIEKGEKSLNFCFNSNEPELLINVHYTLIADGGIKGKWSLQAKQVSAVGDTGDLDLHLGEFKFSIGADPIGVVVSHVACGTLLEELHPMRFLVDRAGGIQGVQQSFSCAEDEAFYGFGERFNALDQRGNTLDNVVYEQFTHQGKYAYIPVPFFLTSKGSAVYFDTKRNIHFNLAESEENLWRYDAEVGGDGSLSFCLWANPNPSELISKTTAFLGKPKLPPNWVFGLWMSANFWDNQQEVLDEVAKAHETDVPATVVVLEAWSDELTFYLWNDCQFDPKPASDGYRNSEITYPAEGRWPDPKGLCDYLHEHGIRLVLWQIPVMKGLHSEDQTHCHQSQHAADQAYMAENGYGLLTDTNEPYLIPTGNWFSKSMVPDFYNPEVVNWWFEKRRYLIEEIGVDGFKTDGGEHIIQTAIHGVSEETGDQLRNAYTHQYQKMYSEFLDSIRGEDMVLFSRSGYTGTQQYVCHWAGDQASDWPSFKAAIYAGLSAALSGISFWSFDIGGFAGPMPSAELYLRSAAMAAFCPIMQYHSMPKAPDEITNTRTPWNVEAVDPRYKVVDIFRNFVNVRMNLIPYILDQAVKSTESGLPLMRSLAIFRPQEIEAREFPYQYFFGLDLLVAPVVESGVEALQVYLPEGQWYDFWTDHKFEGKQIIRSEAPIDSIPVFVRAGSILPLNLGENLQLSSSVGNSVDQYHNFVFKIFPEAKGELNLAHLETGELVSLIYHIENGLLNIEINGIDQPTYVWIPGAKAHHVVLNNDELMNCESFEALLSEDGPAWYMEKGNRLILKTGLGKGTNVFKVIDYNQI